MTDQGEGRVFSSGDANTLFLSIPSDVAVDSAFPFEEGDEVEIRIDGSRIIVEQK